MKKGKGKGSAGKSAKDAKGKSQGKSKGNDKGSVGKPAGAVIGPGQRAQQLKKQRFNKIINDLAMNKAFFMSFVRYPCLLTAEGILNLLQELNEVKTSPEYERMREVSAKKSVEVVDLKRKRDMARLDLKRGKAQYERNEWTNLSWLYHTGSLAEEQKQAEAAYGDRKLQSLTNFLGPRMGE